MNEPISYQPSAFFARDEIRRARTKREVVEIGLRLVRELEAHKAWIREQGFIPPKFFVTRSERRAKGWLRAGPCASKAKSSAKEE
jgi:hypothetical protein